MSDTPTEPYNRAFVEPGTIVVGKYRVERLIGRGGMGLIVAARHIELDELVALKFLLVPKIRAEELQQRFRREAQITARLRSAHVPRTLDFGISDEGDPFIVMEYLHGMTLRQLLRERGALPVDVAVNYVLQACEGLAEAHGIDVVHRDLKPANLFLTKHLNGRDLLKILDFGISKFSNFANVHTDLTKAGVMLGSPKYMAIEQIVAAGEVDERADIWSLGAILYEMLLGKPPFQGATTVDICLDIIGGSGPPSLCTERPTIPEALNRTILRCLCRKREERIANVAELARELVGSAGIDGLEGVVKQIEDVRMQANVRATGQVPAFGQSGLHPLIGRAYQPSAHGGSVSNANSPQVPTLSPPAASKTSLVERRLIVLLAVVAVILAGVIYLGVNGQ